MNDFKRKSIRFTVAIFLTLLIGLAPTVWAEDFQRLSVSELVVTKSARIDGLLQAVANTTGNVWYVHSGTGVNGIGAAGKSKTLPFATLDFAINQASADNNDYIIVMAGHAETCSAADCWDLDKAGITIIGLGEGASAPTFTYTGTAATAAIGAANYAIYNLRFIPGISAIVAGIMVEAGADNGVLSDLSTAEATTYTEYEFVDFIDIAALADGVTVQNCTYFSADATGAANWIDASNGVNKNLQILNNYVYGEFSSAVIYSNDADQEVRIEGGTYTNLTTGVHVIEFSAAATGFIKDVLVRNDTQGTAVDPGSMTMSNVLWDDDSTANTVAIPVVIASAGSGSIGAINDMTTDSLHGKIGTDTEMGDVSLYDQYVVLTAMAGTINLTETSSLHGKIGTDTEMADASLYDMWVLDQADLDAIIVDTTALQAVAGTIDLTETSSLHGKIGTDTEMADASLYDMWVLDQADLDAIIVDTTALRAVAGTIDLTETSSLHGKIGTDTEMGDVSLYDMWVLDQADLDAIIVDTTALVATAGTVNLTETSSLHGKIGTDTEMADSSLSDVLWATGGIAAFPASGLPANGISIAEVLREMYDQAEKSVSGSTAVMVNGDTIFTIAGGPIEIMNLMSVCITSNGANSSTLQYSIDPTVGGAITASGASADLTGTVAGGAVIINMTALNTAPDLSVVAVALGPVQTRRIVANEGVIKLVIGTGSTTGTWKHYLRYRPLGRGVVVTGT